MPIPSPWQPPTTFDEYALVRPLGRGRAGHVFIAHDTLLDRHVAVKFIAARDEALLSQFLREARAAARIQHPNVASLYRVGQLDGHAYLVWELVRGKSLDQLPRPVAADQLLPIAIDIARGLAAAHRRGVLHRDIKPGNVMLADAGDAKLVDFGLAAILDIPGSDDVPSGDRTQATDRTSGDPTGGSDSALLGTPYFMSPEAWRGEPLDARSDLYSFGLLLYELAAGEGPFRHVRVKELAQTIQAERPPPIATVAPSVPAGLARVIDRCLRFERGERFTSADELLAALDALSPARRAAAVPDGNPYRGLRAYEAEHRALFFGRMRPLQLAIERMRSEALLVVTGDSGVGKSSLCAAGVLPAIADGALEDGRRWLVGRTVPGRTPIRNLADALARLLGLPPDELADTIATRPAELGRVVRAALRDELGLLLYLDQMEELVTQGVMRDADLASEALASLIDGLPGVRILGTARSDFLSRLAGLRGLAERLPPALLLLGPMSDADVREAVVGPASIKGGRFESDDLVDELVASTISAQGSLPLLQFTLAELWERRDRTTDTITAASLASVGGVSGALAQHADATLVSLSPADRVVARAVLLRLVTVDDTRARRTEDELRAISERAPAVLTALVRGRLLVVSESPDGAIYEIAHEALVRGWGTLSRWLVEEAELRAARHRLETAAQEWQRLGRRHDLLWSAHQLAELDPRILDGLSPREAEFLDASRRARHRARWMRRVLVTAVLLAVAGAWVGAEVRNRRAVARAVATDVAAATERWDAARAAAEARVQSRRAAFDAWDRRVPVDAETAWAEALRHAAAARARYAEAASLLEGALLRDPGRDGVRHRYADLLVERALLASDERHDDESSELAARLALYDGDGSRRARLGAGATLIVTPSAPGTRLVLTRDNGDPVELEPGVASTVAAGAWLVTATAPGFDEVRQSIYLERNEREDIALSLARAGSTPAGYVRVPAGEGVFGSSDQEAVRAWFNAVPMHPVRTPAYLIAQHETTFGEWIAYLDTLPEAEREQRRPRVAGTGFRGMLELQRGADGTWSIMFQPTDHMMKARAGDPVRYAEREHRQTQDWRRMPVTGISYDDAVAYTRWLATTGRLRTARMCTEHEWERAARGSFDRKYPHGPTLAADDANIDETYGKRSGAFGPDEVGAHPRSNSPFGVADLSGNAWEWVSSSVVDGQVVARGGSYYFSANTARIANRELPERSYRDLTVGFRVCADVGS